MKRLLVFVLLAGCAGKPVAPEIRYQTVEKPVPVSCVPKDFAGPGQFISREDLAKLDGPSRYVAMTEDWLLRVARMEETEVVVMGCRGAVLP